MTICVLNYLKEGEGVAYEIRGHSYAATSWTAVARYST